MKTPLNTVFVLRGTGRRAASVAAAVLVAVLAVICSAALAPAAAAARPAYSVVDLGSLYENNGCPVPQYGGRSWAFGINNLGTVVGMSSNNCQDLSGGAFQYASGTMVQLQPIYPVGFQGWERWATAVNDAGQVVGAAYYLMGYGEARPVLWSDGRAIDLVANVAAAADCTYGGCRGQAQAINNRGDVVGGFALEPAAGESSSYPRAFLYSNGITTFLGTLGGRESYAYGINDAGQIVGSSSNSSGESHAFLLDGNGMKDLGPGIATAINQAGDVVGSNGRAFLYRDGRVRDLGTLGGASSQANAINRKGQVVGESTTASGESRAFLYSGGKLVDLTSLTANGFEGVLLSATGINDAGQIVGNMSTPSGSMRAFILTPTKGR